jgi:hypothetical protein
VRPGERFESPDQRPIFVVRKSEGLRKPRHLLLMVGSDVAGTHLEEEVGSVKVGTRHIPRIFNRSTTAAGSRLC